jgi:hypothetical protein
VGFILACLGLMSGVYSFFAFNVMALTADGNRVYDPELAGNRQFALICSGLLAVIGIVIVVISRWLGARSTKLE